MRLLLCEDEVELAEALAEVLKLNNYSVDMVHDGEQALAYIATEIYDGVILDIMMPKVDGIMVLKKIRQQGDQVPILLLTAKSLTEDKVLGLDCGADDYLTKPFEVNELLARVRSMTRRQTEMTNSILTFNNLSLDRATYEMQTENGSFRLANKEFQMLEMLMIKPGSVISSERFLEKIWGFDADVENNIVWVYASYLRKKLNSLAANCEIVATRNVGYSLRNKT